MTNGITRKVFEKDNVMERTVNFYSIVEDFPEEVHSPTDSSEDSVEVKVEAISIRNKRKCAEPRRVQEGPLKKRMCLQNQIQPFRPWSRQALEEVENASLPQLICSPIQVGTTQSSSSVEDRKSKVSDLPHAYFRPPSPIKRPPSPLQPVALVKRRQVNCEPETPEIKLETTLHSIPHAHTHEDALRVPIHPQVTHMNTNETENMIRTSADVFPRLQQTRKEQRNYKNMTRERRIEANARERTRVHTISAAFDTLRRSIPAYSHSQKLSKLSVLRVACSYILTLSNMLEDDCSEVPQCVEQVTKTIQREGKLRKKKEDSD